LTDRTDQLDHLADAQPGEGVLPPIGTWLQRNLNAATEQVNARNWGNPPQPIATRLRAYKMQCVARAEARNEPWRAKFKGEAPGG
jgi:hypothetical protein